uniref:Peptidase_M16_C domain-containing protein n=1 Tax=Panagrellus redivivus TaxID=6233 RepID=A0A7E4WA40_PANRE
MPYPILTLPYPFARRLCQLLTPEELENLQIAAGHKTRHLKPIIQLIKKQCADELYHFIQKQQTEFFMRLIYISGADADQDELKTAIVKLLKPRFPTVVESPVLFYPPQPGKIEVSFGVNSLSLQYLYFGP